METKNDQITFGVPFAGVSAEVCRTGNGNIAIEVFGREGRKDYLGAIAHLNYEEGWRGLIDHLRSSAEGSALLESRLQHCSRFYLDLFEQSCRGKLTEESWREAVIQLMQDAYDMDEVLENPAVGLGTIASLGYALQISRGLVFGALSITSDQSYLIQVDRFLSCLCFEASCLFEWSLSVLENSRASNRLLQLFFDGWKISHRTKFTQNCLYDKAFYLQRRRASAEIGYRNAVFLGQGSPDEDELYSAPVRALVNYQNVLVTLTSPGPGSGKSTFISLMQKVYEAVGIRAWADEGYDEDLLVGELAEERDGWAAKVGMYEEGVPGLTDEECSRYSRAAFRKYMELRSGASEGLYRRFRGQLERGIKSKQIGFIDTAGIACLASIIARSFLNQELEKDEYADLCRVLERDPDVRIPPKLADEVRRHIYKYLDATYFHLLGLSGNKIYVLDQPTEVLGERIDMEGQNVEARKRHIADARSLRLINLVMADAMPDQVTVIPCSTWDPKTGDVFHKSKIQVACTALIEDSYTDISVAFNTNPSFTGNSRIAQEVEIRLQSTRAKIVILRL